MWIMYSVVYVIIQCILSTKTINQINAYTRIKKQYHNSLSTYFAVNLQKTVIRALRNWYIFQFVTMFQHLSKIYSRVLSKSRFTSKT